MTVIASLAVSLTARTRKFNSGMKRASKVLLRFKTLAVAAIGFEAARAFSAVVRTTEQFNQSMLQSQAIMGDLSETIRTDMSNAAIEVARVTKFSAAETAKSFFFLASAGLDAVQSIKALPTVATFAQAGMFDMALATDLLTDAQSALGLSVEDATKNMRNMAKVGDVLVKANTLANASVQQFSEALTTKAGAALKFLNKDIEEGVAVLAAFADQGIKAQNAGTALNIILRDLTTKAIKNKEAFAEAGIAVFDQSGNMRNLADIIGNVETRLQGLNDAQKKMTLLQLGFSDKSIIFLQTLIGTSEKIRDYENALRSAGGIMATVASKQLTPLQKSFAKLGASIIRLGTALQPMLDLFAVLVERIANAAERMALFVKSVKSFFTDNIIGRLLFSAGSSALDAITAQAPLRTLTAPIAAVAGRDMFVPTIGSSGQMEELIRVAKEQRDATREQGLL